MPGCNAAIHAVMNPWKANGEAWFRRIDQLPFDQGATPRAVVEAAGIKDVLAKSLGSSNHANVVKATIGALRQLRLREQIFETRGITAARKSVGAQQ